MTTPHTGGASQPSAAGLRLVERRTTSPRSVAVTAYTEAMTGRCPYLVPSTERGLTGWTVYEAAGEPEDVEAGIFKAAVAAAEWVRPLAARRHGALVCENVAVLGVGKGVLQWPHWALKNLYGPVGLMFGKFAAGEGTPPAPVSFIPVRVAVRPRDPRFLRDTPDLAAALVNAADRGQGLIQGRSWKEIKTWSRSLLPTP